MVHRREIEGEEIIFGNQGALFRNAMTWWDHDTGTIWTQPIGEAIVGPRKGQRIELLASTLVEWGAWRGAHPDTLALDAVGGSSGFSLDQMMIAVDIQSNAAAYRITDMRQLGVVNDTVGRTPIAVVVEAESADRWAVFSRELDEVTVELELRDDELVDPKTGTAWDPVRGLGISGPLKDQPLALLPAITIFPKDLESFFPDARIFSP